MRKIFAATVSAIMVASLFACGAEKPSNAGSETSITPETSSASAPSEKTKDTYTEDDLNAAETYCDPLSDAGKDIIELPEEEGIALRSFKNEYEVFNGKGIKSEVFKCVFDELSIPGDVISDINEPLGVEQETRIGNLNILWKNTTDSIIVYITTEGFHQ